LTGGHLIIGEEEGSSPIGSSTYTWVIDPLDGTTNFVHGLPVFAVSIALTMREEAVRGLVHVPPLALTYSAVTGRGAYRNGEKIRCAKRSKLSEGLPATGFPYDRAHTRQNNVAYVSRLVPKVRGIRRLGAAACDMCLVAEGVYDAYWELKAALWDFLAGAVIAREAGAVVHYEKNGDKFNILASSPAMLPEICRELKAVGDEYRQLCET
jgi:myo-inositol-1(or 4)-monophosphatase